MATEPQYSPEQADDAVFDMPQESEVRRFLGIFRRRIWILVTGFIIVAVIGSIRAFRAEKVYEAVAKILVERHAPRLSKLESVLQETFAWDQEYYETQTQLIKTRVVLERALEAPGIRELFEVKADPAASAAAPFDAKATFRAVTGAEAVAPAEPWQRLGNRVTAKYVKDTHFIEIRADSGDPHTAAKLANAVAGAFEWYHLDRRAQVHGDAFTVLKREKDQEEQAFVAAQNALQTFREKAGGVSLGSSEAEQPAMKRLNELNNRLTQVQMERIKVQARAELLGAEAGLDRDESTGAAPLETADSLADVEKELGEAQSELTVLTETYGPDHPKLQLARTRVTQLRKQVALAHLGRLAMLRKEEVELRQQYEEQKAQALELSKEMFTYARLENDVDRHRKLLDILVDRLREIDLSAGFVKTNVQVVEQATVPRLPVKPNRMRMVMMALFSGLFLGVVLSLFVEHVDDTIKNPEDAKRLRIPFLGFVPDISPKIRVPGAEEEQEFAARATIMLLAPNFSVAEAYRSIRTSLFSMNSDGQCRTLVISSSGPGEGKTTTATNLALAMAQSGKRVLLVDADFNRPSVHKAFAVTRKVGLTSVLTGGLPVEDALVKITHEDKLFENLDILTAGPSLHNPGELVESRKMQDLLAAAQKKYEWIIVDTPPILLAAHAGILAGLADGVIMVVKSGRHNRALVNRAKESLEGVHASIIGCILNKMVVSRFGRYYSDYYYHGYYRSKYYYYQRPDDDAKPGLKPPVTASVVHRNTKPAPKAEA